MSIEELMDSARVPVSAQRQTLLEYKGCEDVRAYVEDVRRHEPEGINFIIANDCNTGPRMTVHEARTMVWVFVKELILSNRTVKVMNPSSLAEMLCQVRPWDEEFSPDYADHLILTNFFRSGQESPFTPKEVNRLCDYLGERYEYGKATHCVWQVEQESAFVRDARKWYSNLWVDFWLEENSNFWIRRS